MSITLEISFLKCDLVVFSLQTDMVIELLGSFTPDYNYLFEHVEMYFEANS